METTVEGTTAVAPTKSAKRKHASDKQNKKQDDGSNSNKRLRTTKAIIHHPLSFGLAITPARKGHRTSDYDPKERQHWLELAAKQGMDEELWERAVNYYGNEAVERALAREPWEVCELCWSDWGNVRYLLRQQQRMEPLDSFRASTVPGPLHLLVNHRCLMTKPYDPQVGRYPTARSWRKAWRGQGVFAPAEHLAWYCITVRRKWAQHAAKQLKGPTEIWVKKRLKLVAHKRRQCNDLHGHTKTSEYGTDFCCHCARCGLYLPGEPYADCACSGGYYVVCTDCYAKSPYGSHGRKCIKSVLTMTRNRSIYPSPEPRPCDPLPMELLLRLPAEVCYDIAQRVRWAHWNDLPDPMRTPRDQLRV